MSISDLRRGQFANINNIPDEQLRIQLLRFGIAAGSKVCCHTNMPFGPVVLKFGGQEIALGRKIAKQIEIDNFFS